MASVPRAHVRETVVQANSGGQLTPVSGATVNIYSTGTTTAISQTIYSAETGSGTLPNPTTTNSQGVIEFWLPTEQTVDLFISGTGITSQTVTVEALVSLESGTLNLNTSVTPTAAGQVQVNTDAFQYYGTALHTAAALDRAQNFTALQEFSAGISPNGTHTLTLPAATDTLVGKATTDTLTNKTLTSPTMTTAVVSSGGLQVSGNVGFGTSPVANNIFTIQGAPVGSTGIDQFGGVFQPTGNVSATSSVRSIYTQAFAGTNLNALEGINVANNSNNSHTVTISYGILIESQTAGGTNNYGIFVNAPSGGSGKNIGIYNVGAYFTNGGTVSSDAAQLDLQVDAKLPVSIGRNSGNGTTFHSNGTDMTGITVGNGGSPTDEGAGTINVATAYYVAGAALNSGSTLLGASGTAVTAGGSTTAALKVSSAGSPMGVYFGSGAPTISAPQGSLYMRTDGSSTSTRLYVNTNGSTTWTNVTTAA